MLGTSARRRIALFSVCALTALVAVAFLVDGSPAEDRAQAAAGPRAIDALVPAPAPVERPVNLRPLLSIDLSDRFPRMAHALTAQRSLLLDSQIVSYYGNPYTAAMGILGSDDLDSVAARLERQAAEYDELNGEAGVIPAIHLVYAVAQYHPTGNGLYLQYVDDETVQRYIALAEERNMLLFIDLQIGHSSVDDEIAKVLPYLEHPLVHLAIDPEFAMRGDDVPGQALGSLSADDIDHAQAVLQALVEREHLPPKLLIVHQFIDSMVSNSSAIQRYDDVELIIDMDGFGPADIKRVKYQRYATRSYAAHAAIKLFLDHDPDLMSEQDVLVLEPRPAVVIYQ